MILIVDNNLMYGEYVRPNLQAIANFNYTETKKHSCYLQLTQNIHLQEAVQIQLDTATNKRYAS